MLFNNVSRVVPDPDREPRRRHGASLAVFVIRAWYVNAEDDGV
jgi:hypothetical protein